MLPTSEDMDSVIVSLTEQQKTCEWRMLNTDREEPIVGRICGRILPNQEL